MFGSRYDHIYYIVISIRSCIFMYILSCASCVIYQTYLPLHRSMWIIIMIKSQETGGFKSHGANACCLRWVLQTLDLYLITQPVTYRCYHGYALIIRTSNYINMVNNYIISFFVVVYLTKKQLNWAFYYVWHSALDACKKIKKESDFRLFLCTYRLNWATEPPEDGEMSEVTQASKFKPWWSEHATSRQRRLPTILSFTSGWGRNIFVSLKPPRPGNEPRTLAWKVAVLASTLGPRPMLVKKLGSHNIILVMLPTKHDTSAHRWLTVGHRLRRWSNSKPTLDQRLMFSVSSPNS